ncbi:MAG: Gfo/Idh/MocA family oxidoreductase, partial [Clostridia bacterium]|nr:Gfo/Idh/MocA family oxidoreductase [Clostridia bacterium]
MSDKVLSQFKQEEKAEEIKTDRKVKVGIIGTGGISFSHVENYMKMPDVEIVAAADIIPTKAESIMKNCHGLTNCRCYESHEEMINNEPDLDIVSICTYNTQHAGPAIYALDHGINVVLEKPFTVTLEEAIEVMKAEKRSGKVLSIGFQPRYDYSVQYVRDIVQSGVLGKIYYIQTGGGRRRGIPGGTFIEKETGGIGALGDIGCYALDLVLNAIDYPKPLTVTGYVSDFFGKNPKYNDEAPGDAERFSVDDFGAAFIRLEGGIILDFRIAWAMHPDTPGDTIIMG